MNLWKMPGEFLRPNGKGLVVEEYVGKFGLVTGERLPHILGENRPLSVLAGWPLPSCGCPSVVRGELLFGNVCAFLLVVQMCRVPEFVGYKKGVVGGHPFKLELESSFAKDGHLRRF